MNWKLIPLLSLAGVLIGLASVYGLPTKGEQFLWLPFMAGSAWLIARNSDKRQFLHGFLTSLLNCIWELIIRLSMSAKYLSTHEHESQLFNKMLLKNGTPITVSIVMTTLITGLMMAVVMGVMARIMTSFIKKIAG